MLVTHVAATITDLRSSAKGKKMRKKMRRSRADVAIYYKSVSLSPTKTFLSLDFKYISIGLEQKFVAFFLT